MELEHLARMEYPGRFIIAGRDHTDPATYIGESQTQIRAIENKFYKRKRGSSTAK